MKTGEKILCGMLGGSLCAGAAAAWLIAPARPTVEQRDLISGLNFAHRGLYDSGNGVPENSLAAFRLAAEHGYGAELDVRMTRDGVLVIAHDSDLKRMTGTDLSIEEHDYEEISGLRLEGTDEGVPLFADALDILFSADVPVIVELKSVPRSRRDALCSAVLAELDRRDGRFCVESFDSLNDLVLRGLKSCCGIVDETSVSLVHLIALYAGNSFDSSDTCSDTGFGFTQYFRRHFNESFLLI